MSNDFGCDPTCDPLQSSIRETTWRQGMLAELTGLGVTPYSKASANSINATLVKAAPGKVYGLQLNNTSGAALYVKLYDKASPPSPAADAALIVKRFMIPANGGNNVLFGRPITFNNGIAFVIVAGKADTDTTVVAANDVLLNLDYK